MRHFSTLVQFRFIITPTTTPRSPTRTMQPMQNMAYEPAIKLSLPPFNSSSQALSLRELYEENDDMTPGASPCIMAYQGGSARKG